MNVKMNRQIERDTEYIDIRYQILDTEYKLNQNNGCEIRLIWYK